MKKPYIVLTSKHIRWKPKYGEISIRAKGTIIPVSLDSMSPYINSDIMQELCFSNMTRTTFNVYLTDDELDEIINSQQK